MSEFVHIVFGEGVVYRDLSGENDDITEVTENVTYSGTFVNVGTATSTHVTKKQQKKVVKTVENGKVVIIIGDEKWDLSGRKL